MNITKLTLTDELKTNLTNYVEQVLENLNFYITPSQSGKRKVNLDHTDPLVPGINDEFVKQWNLNTVKWHDYLLYTNICSNLSYVSFPPMPIMISLMACIEEQTSMEVIHPVGNFYYPKGGYMGWHTNSDDPGARVYLAYSPTTNGSCFKYVDRTKDIPKVITDWDEQGWTMRLFNPQDNPLQYLWHCVYAPNAPRISYGFSVQ